jgi:hypothetical protein
VIYGIRAYTSIGYDTIQYEEFLKFCCTLLYIKMVFFLCLYFLFFSLLENSLL